MDKNVDPEWTLEEAVAYASACYRPGTPYGGTGRNGLILAWAYSAGRERALHEMHRVIRKYGSRKRAAQALRMSTKTLKRFARSFSEIQQLSDVDRYGVILYFSTALTTIDRLCIDETIRAVLGPGTDCRQVEYREDTRTMTAFVRLTRRTNQI